MAGDGDKGKSNGHSDERHAEAMNFGNFSGKSNGSGEGGDHGFSYGE